jgi:hypothetical protein
MNTLAAEMTSRIQRALKSGKLQADKSYSVAEIVTAISTTRTVLSGAVNRDFGSIAHFYAAAKTSAAK